MKKIIYGVSFLALVGVFIVGRQKEIKHNTIEGSNSNKINYNSSFMIEDVNEIIKIQKFHDALSIGIFDLLDDSLFIHSTISLAYINDSTDLSNNSDFYCYFDELNDIFSNNNRDLIGEMMNSLENNSTNQELIDIFSEYQFHYEMNDYIFRSRIFLIHLDEHNYTTPEWIGRLFFSKLDSGDIPIWKRVDEFTFDLKILNASFLDNTPVFVISSNIKDNRNSLDIDLVPFELEGKKRCTHSPATSWCNKSGRGCKCDYTAPIDFEKLLNSFIEGNLDSEYYIDND